MNKLFLERLTRRKNISWCLTFYSKVQLNDLYQYTTVAHTVATVIQKVFYNSVHMIRVFLRL